MAAGAVRAPAARANNLQLIYAINADLLRNARRHEGFDDHAISTISLIDESGERRIRMANLAFAGSHSVNGVAALHTQLMKETVFADLHRLLPDRINNKTNGITPRRWLKECNPGLVGLVREAIGEGFLDDAQKLTALAPFAQDSAFRDKFAAVKRANKVALAAHVKELLGLGLDPDALFDVQIKRIHEYKRQLLNIIENRELVRPDPQPSGKGLGATGQTVRGQGGAELPQCQNDHKAGQRRGQAGEFRSRRGRMAEGCVLAEL